MPALPKRHRRERTKTRSGLVGLHTVRRVIEGDAYRFEIEPALVRRCLVRRTDIATLRAGARTCGDACRNVLSRLLHGRRHPVH